MKKVLFTTNIPSPYRVSFFNELGKSCDLTVSFESNSSSARNRSWFSYDFSNFNAVYLKGLRVHGDLFSSGICKLMSGEFDKIIIGSYAAPSAMLAIDYARRHKIPYTLNTDGGFQNREESYIKSFLKRRYIGGAWEYLSPSKIADSYLEYYGADPSKLFRYPFSSVKNEEVLNAPFSTADKAILKKCLGINEDTVILGVGSIIPRKGFDILLRASASFPSNTGVYIVGGTRNAELDRIIRECSLRNIHFIPHQTKDALFRYYRCADLFVTPTRYDPWGLVVNEAMANACPVIATNMCIAATEMVNEKNGVIVPVDDAKALASACIDFISDRERLKDAAIASIHTASEYTIERMAEAHLKMLGIGINREDTD